MLQLLEPMVLFLIGVACIAGLWALSAPESFLRLNRVCNTWIETRGYVAKLSESKHSLDRLIYRHHFLSGFLLFAASLSLLYLVLFQFAGTVPQPQIAVADWPYLFYELMLSFACLVGVMGMIVGMIVFIRPSSLKLVESWGNRTVSVEPWLERMERSFVSIDVWVQRHTRLFGGVVLTLSLFTGFLIWEVMR